MTLETDRRRSLIIAASLLALFLGALDALVMTAAMPSIVADLGGMSLYAWVYSAYFLARAVSLPVLGRLSDVYSAKRLMLFSILVFVLASWAAGAAPSMGMLVGARVFQGIGAGGVFALVYVVLSDVSPLAQRGKTLSLASGVWGAASVIGPTLGAVMVTYLSWPWIFYINLPLGVLSMVGIGYFFTEMRDKAEAPGIDFFGILCFTGAVLGGLTLIMTGGREIPWGSPAGIGLMAVTLVSAAAFIRIEIRGKTPFIDFRFFRNPGFAFGNYATFLASVAMFSLFAYAPLFLQGALGRPPMVVGYAMLFLSLGWSGGSLAMGRVVNGFGRKNAAIAGGVLMTAGTLLCLGFDSNSSLAWCFAVFLVTGVGMGFISLSTLLIVQNSLEPKHLGAATSLHQFARTLGGTVGVGICGSLVYSALLTAGAIPELSQGFQESLSQIFHADFRAALDPAVLDALESALLSGVHGAFWVAASAAAVSLVLSFCLPKDSAH